MSDNNSNTPEQESASNVNRPIIHQTNVYINNGLFADPLPLTPAQRAEIKRQEQIDSFIGGTIITITIILFIVIQLFHHPKWAIIPGIIAVLAVLFKIRKKVRKSRKVEPADTASKPDTSVPSTGLSKKIDQYLATIGWSLQKKLSKQDFLYKNGEKLILVCIRNSAPEIGSDIVMETTELQRKVSANKIIVVTDYVFSSQAKYLANRLIHMELWDTYKLRAKMAQQ